ncbi:SLAM family member 9-like isoform X3 [Antechinus flavipes]|uniref:SLAM family member 9-like isoform X3 n=1 Tax=Antechinus flavipes TaxID=38775 RepID=UPI002235467E|nr:SLAM family member 9-like isoform X3 [Antechinus flavipes]
MTHLLQWFTVILFLQIEEAVSTEVPRMIMGTVGKSITLPLKMSSNKIRTIVWLSQNALATVDLKGPDPFIIYTDSKYENRLEVLKNESYSLRIYNLTTEDENVYKGQIILENSVSTEMIIQKFFLHIYEELPKPQITLNFTGFENDTCNVTLLCSVEKEGKNVTYRWTSLEDGHTITFHEGPKATVSWKHGESEPNYICRVTNPVSSQSAQANPFPGLCPGITYFFPVPQQEAVGTTIYAQVNHPNRNTTESPNIPDKKDSVTIYSTIQSPKEREATLPETSAYDKSI